MRIGELAQRTGTTTKTIRYYEDIGLIPEPSRDSNDYRDYSPDAVDRLDFIRDAQATGLTLTEIGSILDLRSQGETTCDHVIDLLERHMVALDRHIENLQQTREQLASLTERARQLNPANCVDPIRCQTITDVAPEGIAARRSGQHLHVAPDGHSH
jgi:DNA-binding transcriptional MerR regulator